MPLRALPPLTLGRLTLPRLTLPRLTLPRLTLPRLTLPLLTLAALLAVALLPGNPVAAAPGPSPASVSTAPWTWPLGGAPTVSRPFEAPPHPFGRGHRGADLAGVPGTPVLSAGNGVVAFAGMVAGRPVVSIDHAEGLRTTYEPVEPSVAAGQPVSRGSPIGVLATGHPDCSAEACLHWGLRRGGIYLDPLALLRPPRIRLLPRG